MGEGENIMLEVGKLIRLCVCVCEPNMFKCSLSTQLYIIGGLLALEK